jgi:hypothetical protein
VDVIFIGLDVGTKGAFAAMDANRKILLAKKLPMKQVKFGKTDKARTTSFLNTDILSWHLDALSRLDDLSFCMEILRPLKSSYGSMNLGINFGILWETCHKFGGVHFVSPADWMGQTLKTYMEHLNEVEKLTEDVKNNSKTLQIGLTRLFYNNEMMLPSKRSKVPHDGIADAIWISDFLRRKLSA